MKNLKFKHNNGNDIDLIKANFNTDNFLWHWNKNGVDEYIVVAGWNENENKEVSWNCAVGGYHSSKESAIFSYNNIVTEKEALVMKRQKAISIVNEKVEKYNQDKDDKLIVEAIYIDDGGNIDAFLREESELEISFRLEFIADNKSIDITSFGGYGYMTEDWDFEFGNEQHVMAYLSPEHAYGCFEVIGNMLDNDFAGVDEEQLKNMNSFIENFRYNEIFSEGFDVADGQSYSYMELKRGILEALEEISEGDDYELNEDEIEL